MRQLLCLLALLPAGCAATDPLAQNRLWRPNGANDMNLRVMVANPLDLLNGAATPLADGATTASAVARYRADKVKALPDSGIAKVTAVSTGTATVAAPSGGDN